MTSSRTRTDYSRIAPDYDADRQEYDSFDPDLARMLGQALALAEDHGCPRVLLDLGCGTGTVLSRFEEAPQDAATWITIGLDANVRMLAVARGKVFHARLGAALASELPLATGRVGCLLSTFAFHHFGGLAPFLAEARRALAPRGRMLLRNILPRDGPEPLMYRFFPEAAQVDSRRFPTHGELVNELERAGFVLALEHRSDKVHRFTPERYAELCRKRTISQLDLILDDAFRRGLEAIAAWGTAHPGALLEETVPVHTFVCVRA